MSLLELVASGNYISVNKKFIKEFGLEEAVILGELCSEYDYWQKHNQLVDGMFYCSISKLEENTGLTEYQQRKAIKSLENQGIIKTQLKGIPATRYFYIVEDKFFNFLSSSSEKTKEQDTKKLKSSNNINNKKENKSIISKDIIEEGAKKQSEWFISNYHNICVSLPKVKAITDKRKKSISKIMKSYSKDDILEVFNLSEESSFMTGHNDRGWKADIDFILREDKFANILEGKYSDKKPQRKRFNLEGNTVPYTEEEKIANEKWRKEMKERGEQTTF